MKEKARVAVVQAASVFANLEASLEKAGELVRQAATLGAELVAFPETWLPGYPAWLDCCRDLAIWDHEPTKLLFANLALNSLVIPGPQTQALSSLVREFGVVLSIGVNERVESGAGHGTLYNSNLLFNRDGTLLSHHRKIMPTFTERLIWGMGDGQSLSAADTAAGRTGALICWEHWMPLARQVLHVSREDIHIDCRVALGEGNESSGESPLCFRRKVFRVGLWRDFAGKGLAQGLKSRRRLTIAS